MRKPVAEVRDLLERAFLAHGASEEEARLFTDVLIEAELCGRPTHGLNRAAGLAEWLGRRSPGRPEIVKERGALVHIDGRDQSGYVVATLVADVAVRVARREGHALVGACNTRHAGMLGYYVTRAARQNVIALMFADCLPLVAPWGGAEPVLGTNPIAAAFPNEPHPILIDMGTSATTSGALDQARRTGSQLPPEATLDAAGRFTRDPHAAGTILPFGHHKGYALGLLVQLLSGVVVGAPAVPEGHYDYGLFMLAMRPDLFAPAEHYAEGVRELIRRLKATRPMDGFTEVLIPGERAFRERKRRLADGISVSEENWSAMQRLAGEMPPEERGGE